MTVEKNHIVSVHYTLNAIEENGQQTFIEKTEADLPFTFLYGVGMMLPKFEKELEGMIAGDKKSFTIKPEEGYGIRNEEAKTQLPIAMFEQSGLPPIGAILPLQDPEGNQINAMVMEVTAETVNVDLNHPMAGQTLNFDIELDFTRPATEEELSTAPIGNSSQQQ
ncbi:FKBP-type peptidyl-prolyl cis-trans isomerase [Frigoriflavimonas asaccharolytica]|uniref:Peptidyl-prolyl cis-trans isomerase n=1 Tax=Frigoriflavimonas asaccharolytica TaxID=2735899 RepID=A0A8J8G6Z0_9FLAO|nr:peptidylprolyl isomerase [Frigoriflavimonas asaccharolytica]NRS92471.1 FKBP-type peptidyl-prolyl cis-trans isomerase SlyD [Frigoriflavimonas asaccharolytica]